MQTNDAHEYTDEQLQAAIDAAFTSGSVGLLSCDPLSNSFEQEKKRRLAIARAFLAALPKPEAAEIAKLKAELAALSQPILADDGRSLGQVAAVRPAIEAECLAQAVRRMEAVPVEELRKVYHPRRSISEGLETVRARLIAAAKGEGQAQAKPSTRIEITEIPDKQPGPVGTLAYAPQAEEPAWIPHDGGPCPLKDEEVEEWEFRMIKEYPDKVFTRTAGQLPSAIFWNVVTHYRVTKPAPGHGPQAVSKADEPATFEAHGKIWTRHTPGDPCPVERGVVIEVLTKDEQNTGIYKEQFRPSNEWDWSVDLGDDVIIAYHKADEPAQAEAKPTQPTQSQQAWTPKPGDVVRLKSGGPEMTVSMYDPQGLVETVWISADGRLHESAFRAACLQPAKEEVRP